MYESAYSENYLDYKTGYPRYVRINEAPPAKIFSPSTLLAGDLVVWKPQIRNDVRGRHYASKIVGTVVESRWSLRDWDEPGIERTRESSEYYPEAVVMWCDGETTNTSQDCLDKVMEDSDERQGEETNQGLRRQRRKTKVTGGTEKVKK